MFRDPIQALIIEDELAARTLLAEYLRAHGWKIEEASDGSDIASIVQRTSFDIIFLDLNLPGVDGQTLCKDLRQNPNIGVIFTTSCDDPVERIIAMENGADAYYVKPLPLREILACAKNLIKRVRAISTPEDNNTQRSMFEDWDFNSQELLIKNNAGKKLSLTRNESRILEFMIENANQPLNRDKLGRILGRTEWHPDDRGIDVLVSKLRTKLNEISGDNQLIRTQYGVGYVFSVNN